MLIHQEENAVTNVGGDGGEVVDGIWTLFVVIGTDETIDVGRSGACHERAVIHVELQVSRSYFGA